MIRWLHFFSLILLVGFIVGSHHISHETQAKWAEVRELQRQHKQVLERIQTLEAEWKYLNGAERLLRLAHQHRKHLGLGPMLPAHLELAANLPSPSGESHWDVISNHQTAKPYAPWSGVNTRLQTGMD